MATLAAPWVKAIVAALDQQPCGRCGDAQHPLKECPVENPKPPGRVWDNLPKNQRQLANEYLKKLPAYSPPKKTVPASTPATTPATTPALPSANPSNLPVATRLGSQSMYVPFGQLQAPSTPMARFTPLTHPTNAPFSRPQATPALTSNPSSAHSTSMGQPKRSQQGGGGNSSNSKDVGFSIKAKPPPLEVALPDSVLLDSRGVFAAKHTHFADLKDKAKGELSKIHEIRPSFTDNASPPSLSVLANYFKVELPNALLHKYVVSVKISDDDATDGEDAPRGKREERMSWFIKNSDYLKSVEQHFATDRLSIIVAWKELGELKRNKASCDLEVLDNQKRVVREAKTLSNGKDLEEFSERYSLTYHGKVAVEDLVNASQGDTSTLPLPADIDLARQALNIVLSKATLGSTRPPFQIGSNKYFTETNSSLLEPCVRGCKGFYSSFKVGMGSPLLNVSTATTAFYEPMSVSEFLKTFRPVKGLECSRAARAALIGAKVKIRNQSNKIKAIKEFGLLPREQTFWRADGDEPTVLQHIQEKKRLAQTLYKSVQASKLPCANLGTFQKKEWFPVEILDIVEHQPFKVLLPGKATSNMINFARQVPGVNRDVIIKQGRELLGITTQDDTNSTLSKAKIRIDESLLEVPARREQPSTVAYSNRDALRNKIKGSWNLEGNKFFSTTIPLAGRIMFLFPGYNYGKEPISDEHKSAMCKELISQLKKTGIQLPEGDDYALNEATDCDTVNVNELMTNKRTTRMIWKDLQDGFDQQFNYAKDNGYTLVVYFNTDGSSKHATAFSVLKRTSEQRFGIHSLCLDLDKINEMYNKGRRVEQYMANAAMKVNLKLGNTNHTVGMKATITSQHINKVDSNTRASTLDLLILGADVTHTQKESAVDMPSLAAVVGSVDGTFGKFLGSMRHQSRDTEIIPKENMTKMVQERLEAWRRLQKRPNDLPSKVLYYRDGVSEAQCTEVRNTEVEAIRDAYRNMQTGKNPIVPNITALVVVKRHHTRIYPKTTGAQHSCASGTIVESGITNPVHFDFFLQSHYPVAGTAKPTYYFVLENSMKFSARDIQDFTNSLCSTYVRATLPVSYAPPAYYADRLCERARTYMKEFYDGSAPMPSWDDIDRSLDAKVRKSQWDSEMEARKGKVVEQWRARYDDNDGNVEGPWHENFNDVMFWM